MSFHIQGSDEAQYQRIPFDEDNFSDEKEDENFVNDNNDNEETEEYQSDAISKYKHVTIATDDETFEDEAASTRQSQNGQLSSEIVIFFIMSYLTGMAMINSPILFRYTGWGGVSVIILVAIVTAYTTGIMISSSVASQRQNPEQFLFYATSFSHLTGPKWRTFLTFLFLLYLFVNSMTVMKEITLLLLGLVKNQLKSTTFPPGMQYRLVAVIFSIVLLPFMFLKSPKRYWPLAVLTGSASIFAGLLLTTLLGNSERKNTKYDDHGKIISADYIVFISTSVCNLIRFFGLHAIIPILLNDMKETEGATRAITTGFIIPTIFIVISAMMSYFAFGLNLLPNMFQLIENTSTNNNKFATIAAVTIKILLCINSTFVILLSLNAVNLYFETSALTKEDNRWKQFAIRAFSLIMVTLCSFAVPESSAFMVLATTILSCIICIIIPLILTTSSNSHAHVFIIHGIIIFVIAILLAGLIYGFVIRSNIAVLEFATK